VCYARGVRTNRPDAGRTGVSGGVAHRARGGGRGTGLIGFASLCRLPPAGRPGVPAVPRCGSASPGTPVGRVRPLRTGTPRRTRQVCPGPPRLRGRRCSAPSGAGAARRRATLAARCHRDAGRPGRQGSSAPGRDGRRGRSRRTGPVPCGVLACAHSGLLARARATWRPRMVRPAVIRIVAGRIGRGYSLNAGACSVDRLPSSRDDRRTVTGAPTCRVALHPFVPAASLIMMVARHAGSILGQQSGPMPRSIESGSCKGRPQLAQNISEMSAAWSWSACGWHAVIVGEVGVPGCHCCRRWLPGDTAVCDRARVAP